MKGDTKDMKTVDVPKSDIEGLNSCKKRNVGEEIDRISSLPDAILYYIFGFLSTIDVVRTSVLATRWRSLWTQIPILKFDDQSFPFKNRENAFIKFVDGVHSLYKASNIKEYHISVQEPCNANFINTWVQFAVQRNVEVLGIYLSDDGPVEMPVCRSIRTLKLQMQRGDLIFPNVGCFSSLESLTLAGINFIDHSFIVDSHCCPQLKCLNLEGCTGLYHLNICCPVLEHLNVEDCYGLDHLIVSGENLRILDVKNNFEYGLSTSLVKISAPNLQSFRWLDYIVDDFYVDKLASLVEAHISLVLDPEPGFQNTYLKHARKFLHHIAHAKSLLLEIPCYWGLPTQKALLEGLPTPPCNLKYLKLLVCRDDYIFRAISCLFKTCSNMEALHIHIANDKTIKTLNESYPGASLSDKMETWNYQRVLLNHLYEVTLCGFSGKEHEVEFVKFLFECSPVLKQMTLVFSQTFTDTSMKNQISQELLKSKTTSRDVVMSFS